MKASAVNARMPCRAAGFPHLATATLELFQECGEMFRDGVVDPIVPGP
jgi:hypothetical protein